MSYLIDWKGKTSSIALTIKKIAFGVLLLLAVIHYSQAIAASLPDTIDKIRPSIVGVGTVMPIRRPSAKFSGTGFVVGKGNLVVTNHHVLPETMNTSKREVLAVFSGRGKQAKAHKVRILRADPEHDLALLELIEGRLPPMKLSGNSKVREGESVAFTGFPIGMVLGLYPITHRGIVSAITPVVIPSNNSKQLTAKQIQRMRNRFEVYQLDGTAYPGNSGSPVYNMETGEVIGVLNSVFVKGTKETLLEKPSGISYAIPVHFVHKLLKAERVSR